MMQTPLQHTGLRANLILTPTRLISYLTPRALARLSPHFHGGDGYGAQMKSAQQCLQCESQHPDEILAARCGAQAYIHLLRYGLHRAPATTIALAASGAVGNTPRLFSSAEKAS